MPLRQRQEVQALPRPDHLTAESPIHVVAAAITDPRGRILLARRTAGRDLAGLWEFPGGKREPDETPEQALVRELDEELGIQVQVGSPLISVPQAYPDKRLRLDVRRVSAWKGIPKGHEGQALAWCPPHKLASYAMPPADIPVVAALTAPDRYLVTPEPQPRHPRAGGGPWMLGDPETPRRAGLDPPSHPSEAMMAGQDPPYGGWLQSLERALQSGIRRLHLRLPQDFPADRRERLLRRAVALAHAAGAEAFIGGDIELARATGAGVHLRAAQLAALPRRPLPASLPVAASCHDEMELRHAQRLGCDFAVLGPVKPTPTHPEASGLGWARFAALRETVSLPIYAIGGLTPADIPKARQHGAQGIAGIRSLWPSGVGAVAPAYGSPGQ